MPVRRTSLRDTGARLTGRYQLMAGDPGHSSARIIGNPWGRVARAVQVLPARHRAPLQRATCWSRLYSGREATATCRNSRSGPAVSRRLAAAGGASRPASRDDGKQILQGKAPPTGLTTICPQVLRDTVGMPADIATELYSGTDPATGEWSPMRGAGKVAENMLPPIVSALTPRPIDGRLGLLAANALMPKLGSIATMFSPHDPSTGASPTRTRGRGSAARSTSSRTAARQRHRAS